MVRRKSANWVSENPQVWRRELMLVQTMAGELKGEGCGWGKEDYGLSTYLGGDRCMWVGWVARWIPPEAGIRIHLSAKKKRKEGKKKKKKKEVHIPLSRCLLPRQTNKPVHAPRGTGQVCSIMNSYMSRLIAVFVSDVEPRSTCTYTTISAPISALYLDMYNSQGS